MFHLHLLNHRFTVNRRSPPEYIEFGSHFSHKIFPINSNGEPIPLSFFFVRRYVDRYDSIDFKSTTVYWMVPS